MATSDAGSSGRAEGTTRRGARGIRAPRKAKGMIRGPRTSAEASRIRPERGEGEAVEVAGDRGREQAEVHRLGLAGGVDDPGDAVDELLADPPGLVEGVGAVPLDGRRSGAACLPARRRPGRSAPSRRTPPPGPRRRGGTGPAGRRPPRGRRPARSARRGARRRRRSRGWQEVLGVIDRLAERPGQRQADRLVGRAAELAQHRDHRLGGALRLAPGGQDVHPPGFEVALEDRFEERARPVVAPRPRRSRPTGRAATPGPARTGGAARPPGPTPTAPAPGRPRRAEHGAEHLLPPAPPAAATYRRIAASSYPAAASPGPSAAAAPTPPRGSWRAGGRGRSGTRRPARRPAPSRSAPSPGGASPPAPPARAGRPPPSVIRSRRPTTARAGPTARCDPVARVPPPEARQRRRDQGAEAQPADRRDEPPRRQHRQHDQAEDRRDPGADPAPERQQAGRPGTRRSPPRTPRPRLRAGSAARRRRVRPPAPGRPPRGRGTARGVDRPRSRLAAIRRIRWPGPAGPRGRRSPRPPGLTAPARAPPRRSDIGRRRGHPAGAVPRLASGIGATGAASSAASARPDPATVISPSGSTRIDSRSRSRW